MQTFIFKVGALILWNGQKMRVLRMIADGRVQLEAESDGSIHGASYFELLKDYSERRLVFVEDPKIPEIAYARIGRSLSTFPEEVQADAIRKKRYLDYLQKLGRFVSTPAVLTPLIQECASVIGDRKPPSAVTVYRWYRELIKHQGDCRALISRHDRKGGGGTRLHPELIEMLNKAIDEHYLSGRPASIKTVWHEMIRLVDKRNEFHAVSERLRIPSRATIYRAINSLDKYDVAAAHFGTRIAKMRFRTSGLGPRVTRILERVEIDHTPLDLFVIDEQTGLPQGRPTVTIAIDAYSKMPVGMHIGFSGTSIEAVFACIRHAVLPKTYIKERYPEIENDWPCYGHFETLVCDNGMEFHSSQLERVAFELGSVLQFCPKRQPYYKGSIERFLKTLNYQFSRILPGHSFAKWFQREDYDPLKDAVLTFDQLLRYLHRWIVDVYMQDLNRGIKSSPYRKWQEGAAMSPPRLLSNLDGLDIMLGRSCERTIFSYGFDLRCIRYNNDALRSLRQKYGEQVKVDVRYYFDDLSLVHVIDPLTKEAIPVPALDQEYARNRPMEQHRLICARAREINNGVIDNSSLARAMLEIQEITKEMSFSKSQRTRQRAAKIRGIKQQPTPPHTPPSCIGPAMAEPPAATPHPPVKPSDLPGFKAVSFPRRPRPLDPLA